MNPWKNCDVRGVYPREISCDLFREVGAQARHFLRDSARVLVAGDVRTSTPALKSALAEGLRNSGVNVIDAGQVPTPVAYFAHRNFRTDAVLIVTGSHNPPEYNGLKVMFGDVPPSPQDLENLRNAPATRADHSGALETADVITPYTHASLERWQDLCKIRKPRLVVDAGNGAWSELAPRILRNLEFEVTPLYCEADGNFPNRPPDCARPPNIAALRLQVLDCSADLGIAWDGDGDRVAFVDHTGAVVSTDRISLLLATRLLRHKRDECVVCDIKLSERLRETIVQTGNRPILERSGHCFIKRSVIQNNCLLGCELSGHYFFRELDGSDDGLFAALRIVEIVANEGPIRTLAGALPPIHATPELRLPDRDGSFPVVTDRLRRELGPTAETHLDGCRMELPDGLVLVRNSVTEPVITIRMEGISEESLDRLIHACSRAIPEFRDAIKRQLLDMEAV